MSLVNCVETGNVQKSQPFFPNSPHFIPVDVVRIIMERITDIELARMREVSRSWNVLILGCNKLNNRLIRSSCISACFTALKTLQDLVGQNDVYDFVQFLRIIARVQ